MTHRKAKFGKIEKAAIRLDEKIYTGWRHADILHDMREDNVPREKLVALDHNWDQGFITETGHFLSRAQALSYGRYIGQVDAIIGSVLTSEDLWENDGTPIPLKESEKVDYSDGYFI